MDESDISISSSFCTSEELIALDPERGREVIRRVLNQLSDGRVACHAETRQLNTDSDAMVLRDRLERYEVRRYFGADAARWDPSQDEFIETLAAQPNLQIERDLSASFVYVPSAPAERTTTAEHLKSSPLRPVILIDLTSDSAASAPSRVAETASYLRNNPGNLNPSSFGSHPRAQSTRMSFTPIPPEMRDGFERLPGLTLPLEPLRHSLEGTREGNRNSSTSSACIPG